MVMVRVRIRFRVRFGLDDLETRRRYFKSNDCRSSAVASSF